MRIDVDALLANVDLVKVVGAYVDLERRGAEWVGLCPFHAERSPSFAVVPAKGWVHCFGCGAHHDAIGFLMRMELIGFRAACERLGASEPFRAAAMPAGQPQALDAGATEVWVPLTPAPDDVPPILGRRGWTSGVWNPKRGRIIHYRPKDVYTYRDATGGMLGHVLRLEFVDKSGRAQKITPQVTWCVGEDGVQHWCLRPFQRPRPLFGLDLMARRPSAPVLLPEGEKCAAASAALADYVAVTWPGGVKGIPYVDWSPLAGRDVVLWPDADPQGVAAVLGDTNRAGEQRPGVAQYLHRVGVRSLSYVDVTGQPKGWDVADALLVDRWTPAQVQAWAEHRMCSLHVQPRRSGA